MANTTLNTRLVIRNAELSAWEKSTVKLLQGEMAFAQLSGTQAGQYKVRIGTGDKTWNELSDQGQLIIPVKNVEGLKDLTDEILLSISNEINARKAGDTYLSGKIDGLTNDFNTLTGTTLPELSGTLESNLSIDVKVEAGTGDILSSYVISQGGVDKAVKINIPKDKVVESASVVKFNTDKEAQEATGDPTAKAGTYIKLVIQNQTKAIYLPVPELVNTYKGHDGKTIKLDVVHESGEDYTISAYVKEGTIGSEHLTTALSGEIAGIKTSVADEAAAREAADTKLSSELSTYAETKAAEALTSAKAYTDALSTATDAKIAQEVTDRNAAIEAKGTILSAYVVEKADAAEAAAKSYTDAEIAKLSVADIYETKTDAAAKLAEAKSYTDALSTATDTKIATARTNLSAYARETADNALTAAKAYTDSEIADLSAELKGDVATALADSKAYTDALSTAVDTKIDAEKTRATAAEAAVDSRVTALSGEVSAISADHEGRITANTRAIELLSSAVHFRGVITKSEISSAGDEPTEAEIKAALVKKFKPCAKGDIAIYTDAGTEYIYTADTAEVADGWVKLGDEGTYVTKAAFNAKVAELEASDSTLSGMVAAEETRAKGIETGLSTDLYALSGKYDTFTGTTYVADKAALEATDTEISGKVDNKVKVGTYGSELANQTSLSVVKIADEDYYKLVSEGKQNNDVVYIVSSDNVNGHDKRVINVGAAISATDAVNLSGMNAAIEAAKQEIVANALSGVTLNGQKFTVTNNVAELSIDIINCGGAL